MSQYSPQDDYNKFTGLDEIPYNIISYLIDNDEETWKMMGYRDPNCWKPSILNLTKDEKRDLIYDGIKKQTDCRVFMDVGADYAWTIEATILRISILEVQPLNHIRGNFHVGFEVYTHYNISTMSNYKTRNLAMINRLLEIFNGAEIGGLGRIYFDYKASPKCRIYPIGQIPYKGMGMIMCNHIA